MTLHENELGIHTVIEQWAKAVREKDTDKILLNHTEDMVMFDVPPPMQSRGLEEYRKTWDTFYTWSKDSGVFAIESLNIVADIDVAFCYALMRCSGFNVKGELEPLQFRLTMGLQKINGSWKISHEHHSLPSE